MKRLLTMILCVLLLVGLLPISAQAATTIDSLAITGVVAPKAGDIPTKNPSITTQGVQIYAVDWYDRTAQSYLASNDSFIKGHIYEAQIWVQAANGYEFAYANSYTPQMTATINSKTATVAKAYEYNAWAMVVVGYTFYECPENTMQSVSLNLPGVTKVGNELYVEENSIIPEELTAASADISLYPALNTNRYYPNGFYWSNTTKGVRVYGGERFQGGCDYYVTIAIKPNSGSAFTDDLVVTVNGKQATLKAKDAGYAEVGIPMVCYGSITGLDVRPVVALPKDGNYPDTDPAYYDPQCKHIDYAAVTGWYDVETGNKLSSGDTFVGGKQYRVEMYCMAAYPYKFQKDANNKMEYAPQITGWDVDSYSFGFDDYRYRELIYLSKTFTAEERDHICEGQWQSDETGHEKYCSTCGKALAGGAHWSREDATCIKGKVCEVCGYEFTEPSENHDPDTSKWIARADMYHYHPCKLCGAHCDIEDHRWSPTYLYQDKTGHAYTCADCKAHSTIEDHVYTDNSDTSCNNCSAYAYPGGNTLVKENGIWYHVVDRQKVNDTTLVKFNGIWFYVKNGAVDFDATTLFKFNGYWFYIKNGEINYTDTLVKFNGIWFHVKNGQIDYNPAIVTFNGIRFYTNDGQIVYTSGLTKVNGTWYYLKNGQVDNTDTLVKFNGYWFHVKNGQIDYNPAIVTFNGIRFYTNDGQIQYKSGLTKVNGTWYYLHDGQVDNSNTLVKFNGIWFHVNKGVIDYSTTLVKFNGYWFYVKDGQINYSTTLVKFNGYWFYVKDGQINYSTTLVKFNGIWFYVANGQVDFNYSGKVQYNGIYFTVKDGVLV